MLGYHPFTEDTCNGENRPMDLTWWGSPKHEYWHDFILHMERENLFNKDEETLEKLDEVYAYLLNKSEVIDSRKASVSRIAGTLYMQLE
jgi:hypothetical protein